MVAGDQDQSALSTPWPRLFTDVYHRSPGVRGSLTLFGAEHMLGGIHAYHAEDITDESPERVALVRRACWAYLRHALGIDDIAWQQVRTELAKTTDPIGTSSTSDTRSGATRLPRPVRGERARTLDRRDGERPAAMLAHRRRRGVVRPASPGGAPSTRIRTAALPSTGATSQVPPLAVEK
ncbi:hypothetical protein [Actinoalloteichus caeruleus]|uniref:hypothetical protein n=1 Tax=Actinoalloteichus cyanogriseus TaxID=2893586 RepID=UPI003AAEF0F6